MFANISKAETTKTTEEYRRRDMLDSEMKAFKSVNYNLRLRHILIRNDLLRFRTCVSSRIT